ncbi:MAG: response regulator, partial [Opitutales bacterium]
MQTPCDEILILDDEASYAEMLSSMLREEGFNAQMLTKPGEAIEYIRRHPCALVVADYKMPDLNGAEFLQQVRESHPNLPVIMVSGHMNTRDLLSVANMSVTLVLEKPFDKDIFIENVRRFVAPRVAAHPEVNSPCGPGTTSPFPTANLHCSQASAEAKAFLQSLWTALCQHNGATLSLPLGGELDLVVADVESWFGLESPALRLSPAAMQVDQAEIAQTKVLAVVDARYASTDLG